MTARPCAHLSMLALTALLLAFFVVPLSRAAAAPDLNQVIVLINDARRAAGCNNLLWEPHLARAAQRHANDMARRNYFSHKSRNGASFATRIRHAGYRYRLAAENIAAGDPTTEAVVASWMASPRHRANMLNCHFQSVGVGYSFNPNSMFGSYWVLDLGTPR